MSEAVHIHIKEDDFGSHKVHGGSTKGFDNKVTALERLVLSANFILELPSAIFDQLSSVHKLQFSLVSMLISYTVFTISIIELVYRGRKERVTLKRRGFFPWFYYPYPNSKPFGTFPDIVGLVCSIFQCIFATIAYVFLSDHSDNPIKVSFWPIIFSFGLLYSRLSGNYYARRSPNPTPLVKRLNRAEEFTLLDLITATNNFSLQNKLGEGPYGVVYRGKLSDGREVAIKREVLSQQKEISEEELGVFESELTYLSRLHHKYLVSLIGYCEEDNERLLVYEYLKNGSLYNHLHDKNKNEKKSIVFKSWKMRIKIALEAARGIEYLHNYAVPPIIHGNIKSANILLDQNWTARVSDFGFSSSALKGESDKKIKKPAESCEDTIGYIDPECYSRSVLTTKSDVYSFGMMLLEVLTGKKPIFRENGHRDISTNLVDFAVPKILGNQLVNILDRRMGSPESANEVEALKMMAFTAVHSVNSEGNNRPTLTSIVSNLEQALSLSHASVEDSIGRSDETKPLLTSNKTITNPRG